jgi:hypothetical protein
MGMDGQQSKARNPGVWPCGTGAVHEPCTHGVPTPARPNHLEPAGRQRRDIGT